MLKNQNYVVRSKIWKTDYNNDRKQMRQKQESKPRPIYSSVKSDILSK